MGKLYSSDFSKNSKDVYEYGECAGCHKPVNDKAVEEGKEKYMVVVLPYGDYKKYILLCEACYKEAQREGIF